MRIALVTQFFPPETAAGANRAGAMAGALGSRHDLQVLTLAPGYPEPELYAGIDLSAADRGRAFQVRRGAAFRPHDRSLVRRALREAAMSLALVRSARGPRPDVVFVTTPSMFLAPVAWCWARWSGARFAWDVRDLTWTYARENARPGGLQHRLLGGLEAFMLGLLKRTDFVVAATEGLAQVLLRHGVPPARMITLANGVPRAFLERFAGEAGAEATTGAPRTRPRVSYIGLMGFNHGIGILVDVARLLPEVDFVLVGDGPERPALEARLRGGAAPNVRRCPYVTDPDVLAAHYRDSDLLVSHVRSTPVLDDIVYPAKAYEYFATGRPVVYAGTGFTADRLRRDDLALVVPPDDAGALARGIAAVLAGPAAARQRAARARHMVETECCREVQLERLVNEFEWRLGTAERPGPQ